MAKEIKIEHKGTVKHILEDDRAKKITVRLILAWIFSIVFILAGLGSFVNASIGSGVCFLLAGLVLFPPIDKALRNNYNFYFSSWLKFFIVLILIIVAGSLAVSHNVANSYSNKPVSDVAGGSDVSGIAPRQQVNTLKQMQKMLLPKVRAWQIRLHKRKHLQTNIQLKIMEQL